MLNALGDSQKQKSQAQQCLAQGAKVILLDQLERGLGHAITNLAVQQGAKVIDYDRLVVGSKAAYYVSFDNVRVGKLQGKGLVDALKANGAYTQKPVISELNGGITDNNAKLFKQGYDSVLDPLYANGTLVKAKAGDQFTDWDPIKGRQIFDQMLARNHNDIKGSIAAQRRSRRRRDRLAQGPRPEADSADRPGRDANRASSSSSRATSRARSTSRCARRPTPLRMPRSRSSRRQPVQE